MIETRGLLGSLEAVDTMLKSGDVSLVKKEIISPAMVTIIIEGDVGAVKSAIEAGIEATSKICELISYQVIPHPDDQLRSMLVDVKRKEINKSKSKNKKVDKNVATKTDDKNKDGKKLDEKK